MKKIGVFFVYALAMFCLSCSTETITPPSTNQMIESIKGVTLDNGRLKFDKFETYLEFSKKLEEDSKFLKQFLGNYDFKSLEKTINMPENQVYADLLPIGYRHILNNNAEVIIGEDLVWFGPNKEEVFLNLKNLSKLEEVKLGKSLVGRKYKYGFNEVPINKSNKARVDLEMGNNALYANHQKEFTSVSPSSGNRKFVHELRSFSQSMGNSKFQVDLYLYIKLEWKGCCNWQLSSQSRDITYNLSISGYYKYLDGPWYSTRSFLANLNNSETVSDTKAFRLNNPLNFQNVTLNDGGWIFSVEGSITHQIVGDVLANRWQDNW